jgi:transaldolase
VIDGDQVTNKYDDANAVLDALDAQGISYEEVTALLEKEGVEKFIVSWNELLDTVTAALESAQSGTAETESAKSGSDHTVSTEAEAAK